MLMNIEYKIDHRNIAALIAPVSSFCLFLSIIGTVVDAGAIDLSQVDAIL